MWHRISKADSDGIALADRHYSRVLYGKAGQQLGPPGRLICLFADDGAAVWVSHWPYAQYALDGLDAFRCSLFRTLSRTYRASDMILEAHRLTEAEWGDPPRWLTYVRRDCVSPNPGYCFKAAGYVLDRTWKHPDLDRLLYA